MQEGEECEPRGGVEFVCDDKTSPNTSCTPTDLENCKRQCKEGKVCEFGLFLCKTDAQCEERRFGKCVPFKGCNGDPNLPCTEDDECTLECSPSSSDDPCCSFDCKSTESNPQCTGTCGDRIVQEDLKEECDDGNTFSDDGCSSTCKKEFCGDGITQASEECDEGGNESTVCAPDCTLYCGNGEIDFEEQCDDGNRWDRDGCSSTCQLECDLCASCGGFSNGPFCNRESCEGGGFFYCTFTPDPSGNGGACEPNPKYCGSASSSKSSSRSSSKSSSVRTSSARTSLRTPSSRTSSRSSRTSSSSRSASCPFVDCVAPPTGCHYENPTIINGCPINCGKLVCRSSRSSISLCGNGRQDSGEQCGEPGLTCPMGLGCDTASCTCRSEILCGNGTVDPNEQCGEPGLTCDPGTSCDTSRCACVQPRDLCGNRRIDSGEQCDPPWVSCPIGQTCDAPQCLCSGGGGFCGNGRQEPGEQCDDGNSRGGDGCSVACVLEPGVIPRCGDGMLTAGEQCDDGNARPGDGCSATCNAEVSFAALSRIPGVPICGDRALDLTEQCEDGNTVSGDECSNSCTLELGYMPRVGDRIITQGEECDDGNVRDFDGCSSTGLLEIGFCGDGIVEKLLGEQCEPALHDPRLPFTCGTDCRFSSLFCGNGVLDLGEECDAGTQNNDVLLDRCRTNCSFARCGDFVIDTGEQCDDGNRLMGDGCDRFCRVEVGAAPQVAGELLQLPLLPGLPPGFPPPGRAPPPSGLPTQPTYGPLPATVTPIQPQRAPVGETGPAAIAVMAAGAAAGWSFVRRRRG